MLQQSSSQTFFQPPAMSVGSDFVVWYKVCVRVQSLAPEISSRDLVASFFSVKPGSRGGTIHGGNKGRSIRSEKVQLKNLRGSFCLGCFHL